MPTLDKKTGRHVRPSKADVLTRLKTEASAQRVLEWREAAERREPWIIPVPLLDHDPDLAENAATCASIKASIDAYLNTETGSGEGSRLITVATINGEKIEMLVQPSETVRALAKRLAFIKGVGRVMLLADHTPLPEAQLVLDCVPRSSVVTAVLQFGFDSPNALEPIVEQQIRLSCEKGGAGPRMNACPEAKLDPEAFWSAAFEKANWEEFAQHIGTQDFQIRVFSFGLNPFHQTRYIYYNFGIRQSCKTAEDVNIWAMTAEELMAPHGTRQYGSVHAENEVSCTAELQNRIWVKPSISQDRFLEDLEAAAYAKHGVEKYGAW